MVKNGSVAGHRQRVVHQGAGQELAALVVDEPLAQRLADALGHRAVDLALDDHRIDDGPAVLDDHVVAHRRRARSPDPPPPTATCTAPEKVGPGGSKRCVASSPGSIPAAGRPAGARGHARDLGHRRRRDRACRARSRARPRSTRSAGLASSSPPAIASSLRRTRARRRVRRAALGDRAAAREGAGAAPAPSSVSGCRTVTASSGTPS